MIDAKVKQEALLRLRKIGGQIKGVHRMVDEEKYCIDIINQITAVRRALDQVSLAVMKRHMESCLSEAIQAREGTSKIDEFMETVYRFVK